MSHSKRIFIIGHPGAGKALLAKTLAQKLGWEFIDADLGLEFRIGRTVTQILDQQGEQAFLNCQAQILATQFNKENIVVTTDASIVCSKKNRQLLSSECVVYLKVSTGVQLERTARNLEQLLPVSDLKQFLVKLHDARDSLFEQVASLTIDSDDSALEKHVSTIINQIQVVSAGQVTVDKKDSTIYHKTLHTPVHLPSQQAKCLKLLAQGKSSKEIAADLNVSYRTVEGYIARTMELLGCTSSKELVALYHGR